MSHATVQSGATLAYAYGRMANLKDALLSETDRNRLLGASDGKDTAAILTELPFTKYIDQGISEPHQILSAVENWIQAEVFAMTPANKQAVLSVLWTDRLAALTALVVKHKHGFTQDEAAVQEAISHSPYSAAWEEFLHSGSTTGLPVAVQFMLNTLDATFSSAIAVDTACFTAAALYKKQAAKKSGSKQITAYIAHSIDCQNILNTLRFGSHLKAEHILPGGTLPTTAFTQGLSGVKRALAGSNLLYELTDAISKESFENIEQLCTNVLKQDLANMWNTPLSIEPLFAFAAVGLNHCEYARNVYIGKINNLDPQQIKQLLPAFIPASAFSV